jgi:hypothetical protein
MADRQLGFRRRRDDLLPVAAGRCGGARTSGVNAAAALIGAIVLRGS